MRCTATITGTALSLRSRNSPTDPQCQRPAVSDGLCYQHARIRFCQARDCDRRAVTREGDWWFCRRHAKLWADHNAIVNRVRQIPPRA